MRGILVLGMLAASAALPAGAGTLYKCTGADGIPNYVSKRIGGASCEAVSRYRPSTRAARTASVSRPPEVSAPSTPSAPSTTPAVGAVASAVESSSIKVSVPAAPAAPPPATPARGGDTRRVVSGQVYSYVKDGVRHFTSARPQGVEVASLKTIRYSYIQTCFACGNPGVNFGRLRLNTEAYRAEIAAASREFGVDEAVIRAIMHAESSYNPMALSHAGAQGLMQLMPATATRFGVTDPFDASQNIRGGVKYLAWLLKRFNGNLTLAAAGYNAGEGAVDRHGGVPPYKETQRYVERVAVLADRYRGAVVAR
ncbi:lytic transglycosylase domain-containing protein [Pseudoxanthomonas mexicana]|uniref:lytic transglycosylase domain-containing protein n=1 Tax=Pseudoxanthomonas mexicana TaxID=128785 RepID=UPI00398AF0A3